MKEKFLLVYFLVGFIGIVFLNLNMIALTIVGATIAVMHYKYSPRAVKSNAGPSNQNIDDDDEEEL
jgi:PTS system mannose-specific IIC component